jgi:hypothetical protein
MDAADWYLNLLLRGHIDRTSDNFWTTHIRQHPIARRDSEHANSLSFLVETSADFPPDIREILNGREPHSAVQSLTGVELYFFERRLPEPIREFGRSFVPGMTTDSVPAGFRGPIDNLSEPRLLGLFARINLSLPDDVILEDLRDFIKAKRAELARIDVPQPFREALRVLGKRNAARLKTFVRLGVLPYLDLNQWLKETSKKITGASLAEILEIWPDDVRETRRYAAMLINDMTMRGWLTAPARAAIRKSRRN